MSWLLYVQAACLVVACVIALLSWLVPYLSIKTDARQGIERAIVTAFLAVLSVSLPTLAAMIVLKLAGVNE